MKPDPKVPLALTEAERKLIVEDLEYFEDIYASVIRATPTDQPVRFTVEDWTSLADCITAEANQARDKRLKKELDRLHARILDLLDKPPTTLKIYRGEDENAK
jgi:hypothetical protein